MHSSACVLRVSTFIMLLYLGGLAAPICAQASDTTQSNSASPKVLKNRLIFSKGKVLLQLPKGLRAFTAEDFSQHFGSGHTPEYAFLDDSTDSRIAISVTPSSLAPSELSAYKTKMESALPRSVKGLFWRTREMLKVGEVEWIHLEVENISASQYEGDPGSSMMNDFYVTSFGGHPLMFTITTSPDHWYGIRKKIQKMMMSVTLQEGGITKK